MDYQEYINLGFKRTEINDPIEFKQTGYYGYSLEKEINNGMTIAVCGGELNHPKLLIKKRIEEDRYHYLLITPEIAKDLISSNNAEEEI